MSITIRWGSGFAVSVPVLVPAIESTETTTTTSAILKIDMFIAAG